jgi:integrase/recombinase XerD
MTMEEAVSIFLSHCRYEKHLSPKTLRAYSIDLRQLREHLAAHHQATTIAAVDKAALRHYVQSLFGARSPKTIKRKVATTRAFLNFLEREDLIPFNPLRKLDIRIKEGRRLPRTIPLHDLRRLFHYLYDLRNRARGRNPTAYRTLVRDIAALELLFATGARVSEVCQLRTADIDLQRGQIRILGKGSRERIIHLCDPETLAVLTEHQRLSLRADSAAYGPFFRTATGNALSEQAVRHMLHKRATAAGIDFHVTPHMLRHSLATLLLEEGVDIRYIQRLLGHSSIATTQIYTEVHDAHQQRLLATKHPLRLIRES